MPKLSKQNASLVEDFGVAEDRHDDLDGYTVNFVTIRQDHDLAPMLQRSSGRELPVPALGLRLQGSPHDPLRRPRRDRRGRRGLLHATGSRPRGRGRAPSSSSSARPRSWLQSTRP